MFGPPDRPVKNQHKEVLAQQAVGGLRVLSKVDFHNIQIPNVVLGIDGGLIHKGYHAFRGQYNGVHGLVSVLIDALLATRPLMAFVAWDSKRTWRHDLYEGYKANRNPMPPDLLAQLEPAREVVSALGAHNIYIEGFEADDILGAVADKAKALGLSPCIISSDYDLCQLIDDRTEVRMITSGFSIKNLYTWNRWTEEKGYPPNLIPDYKALAGDRSDNIPGVPGIGQKRALALIQEYGPLEEIFKNQWRVTGKAGRQLSESKDQALFWRSLTSIRKDLPIQINWLKWRLSRDSAVRSLIKYNLYTNKVQRALSLLEKGGTAKCHTSG